MSDLVQRRRARRQRRNGVRVLQDWQHEQVREKREPTIEEEVKVVAYSRAQEVADNHSHSEDPLREGNGRNHTKDSREAEAVGSLSAAEYDQLMVQNCDANHYEGISATTTNEQSSLTHLWSWDIHFIPRISGVTVKESMISYRAQ